MAEELAKKRQERRDEIFKFMDTQVEAVRDELTTLIMKMEADQSNISVVSREQNSCKVCLGVKKNTHNHSN